MKFTVTENAPLTPLVWKMQLSANDNSFDGMHFKPGQFIQLQLPELYLRRPISVCDWSKNSITIVYKVVGIGTEKMAGMNTGVVLDALSFLGNGFDISNGESKPLLIGGGVGLPPLFGLSKALKAQGKKVQVLAGFGTQNEIFLKDMFDNEQIPVTITTIDGSYENGTKGVVTDVISKLDFDYIYCCGPEGMLKAVYNAADVPGQFSFEERMGCGFGACMGCSCKTKYGNKRICKDGPVLMREEIIW